MAIPERTLTTGGDELHFATNHLGHFALASGLADALRASGDGRIVSVSSSASLQCPVLFDDLTFAFVAYDPFAAYGQSKTANVLFAVEADRRWARDGIRANALMPGGIATNLQRHVDPEALAAARRRAGAPSELKTVAQGAATSVLAAASPLLQGIGGRYLEDCGEAQTLASRADGDGRHGVAPYALDPENAQRLWETSERRVASVRAELGALRRRRQSSQQRAGACRVGGSRLRARPFRARATRHFLALYENPRGGSVWPTASLRRYPVAAAARLRAPAGVRLVRAPRPRALRASGSAVCSKRWRTRRSASSASSMGGRVSCCPRP